VRTMIGELVFDDINRTLHNSKRGFYSELTPQENKTLMLLVSEPGRLRTYEEISMHLSGKDRPLAGYKMSIRGTIKRIRKKMGIGSLERNIRNRSGHGYIVPLDMVLPVLPTEDAPPHKCPKCGALFYT
jgi:DNA-binding response OmpR family regulator